MTDTKNEISGILPINKSAGITSHDAVNKMRRIFGTKKIGHTGTLDPMATGVLVMLIGRAAKAADFVSAGSKRYLASIKLGIATDTEDITGTPLAVTTKIPTRDEFYGAAEKFIGDIYQTPPMYSAVKVGGKKLVDLARQGIEIEREKRMITVHSIGIEDISVENGEYYLDIKCSKGTYIRTVCADIGKELGCGAVMASLVRTENSGFAIDSCHTLEELEEMKEQGKDLSSLLLPIESVFADLPRVQLPDFFSRLAHSGLEIYQKKIGSSYEIGQRVRMADKNGFFALGEVCDYPDGTAIKPIKQF